ncbi:MAG: alpha/beta hydrolase [Candidatus Mcinerneyibacterium aminivorans]|uniref:Alpha/beta hydrolase n=1 Tax=Candidatus Mcinerneyibacterium aminivorans TaxID=2703815 RepID=A0A5D0MEW8_9BACT|nr:MAG: alpha/beta hydrolase [Candidatus Mcinerneyibacterium aminivorans]
MIWQKLIFNIILLIAIAYFLIGLFFYFMQKSFIYHPDEMDFESCEGFEDYEKINHNGTRFYFKKTSGENVLIYYHGNAGSACSRSNLKHFFENCTCSLIFVEYAGYAGDEKKPSKNLILEDVKNVKNFLESSKFKNVIVYGQSIGSGPASYHASLGGVDSLILVSPFSSLEDVAQSKFKIYPVSLILKENYTNVKWLSEFKGHLKIFHGDRDSVVDHKFSKKLYENINIEKKDYVLIENRGHNDIWDSEKFQKLLKRFIINKSKQIGGVK